MLHLKKLLFCMAVWAVTWADSGHALNFIVLDARGGGLKPGMTVDSGAPFDLKEGERVTVIGPDGKSATLKGPLQGRPLAGSTAAANPRQALAALLSTRDARVNSVGVVRAGSAAGKLPDPWLIDVTRPGIRCLMQGEQPAWWRPDGQQESFMLFTADRSWSAQFTWAAAQDRQVAPALSRYEGVFVIRHGEREYAIHLVPVPRNLGSDFVVASWLLEKGCFQQADALLERLRQEPQNAQ